MADKKITQLTPIVGADLVSADEFVVVDVSADETKSIVLSELINGIAALPKSGGAMTGAITTNSTFAGRDVATDCTKLDTIEANADVTDTTNVTAAGALMDSELTNIAAVKAINQSLVTTSSPTFVDLTLTDDLQLLGPDPKIELVNGTSTDQFTRISQSAGDSYYRARNDLVGGEHVFQTQQGAVTVEVMRLDGNGLVGIGTASPTEALDVAGTVKATSYEGSSVSLNATTPRININETDANNGAGVAHQLIASGGQLYIQARAADGTNDGGTINVTGMSSADLGLFRVKADSSTFTGSVDAASYTGDGSQLTGIASPVKAWVNFNGTGTVAIRDSFNVSSITDNGTGDYTVNFAVAMTDANFSYSHAYSDEVSGQHTVGFFESSSASTLRVRHFNAANSGNRVDKAVVAIAVFR
jgi:hypothetical protein